MPFRSNEPLLRVEPLSMHTIDTTDVNNLFGLWSVFSKCADTMEDGKRLENLSWRLWNRETLCCAPDLTRNNNRSWSFGSRKVSDDNAPIPELSCSPSSPTSSPSSSRLNLAAGSSTSSIRPELLRQDSAESCRKSRHMTPADLESMVLSIKEKKELEPISLPLPAIPESEPTSPQHHTAPLEDTTPRPSSPPPSQLGPEFSTSTVATAVGSDASIMSQPAVGSEASTSTDFSAHSVVRGFGPGRVSSSLRSKTQLAPPAPILKSSPSYRVDHSQKKKKGAMFTLGGSSDEGDASSLETHMTQAQKGRSSLSEGLCRKTTSFKEEVTQEYPDTFEDSEEEDEDVSESAIEEDDDEDQWEDSESESGPSSVNERDMFQRVDSRPNLTSRRSLLTSLMHEGDRAAALQNAASRSTPALRRSRTSSPNGPSTGASPQKEASPLEMRATQVTQARPIIMTTSNGQQQPALSPRTTRRNMLSTELTESLRKHLLWERQQRNQTSNAASKRMQSPGVKEALQRRHTSKDLKELKEYPKAPTVTFTQNKDPLKNGQSWNNYFDHGLQEYHEKGW